MATVTTQPGIVRTSHSGSVEYLGGMSGVYEEDEVELEERKPMQYTVRTTTSYISSANAQTVQYQHPVSRTPPGLEKLDNIKTLVLHQNIQSQETWWGRYTFKVGVGDGKDAFTCEEISTNNGCFQAIAGKSRPYLMKITDDTNQEVILELEHPYNCWSPSLCPWSLPNLFVRLPNGDPLGQIKHTPRETCRSCLGPSTYFEIYNHEGKLAYRVQGPPCYPCECKAVASATFTIIQQSNSREEEVGHIEHEWRGPCGGLCSWCVTDIPDYARVTFSRDLPSEDKALFLGLLILVASCYYEIL